MGVRRMQGGVRGGDLSFFRECCFRVRVRVRVWVTVRVGFTLTLKQHYSLKKKDRP